MTAELRTAAVPEARRPEVEHSFDLHGIVGLRLVDAPPAALATLRRELVPLGVGLEREPDIVVRFVDRIERTSPARSIGSEEVQFTDRAFLVGVPGSTARAEIPFDQIGGRCEIVCERALPRIPLLRPIVHLTALAHGYAPAHASAVELAGRGIVTTGWTSGGKTGALLALMSLGARFIGDDMVFISPEARMFGLHEPISMKYAYLAQSPELRSRLTPGEARRLRAVGVVEAIAGALPEGLRHAVTSPRARRRLSKWATTLRTVHVEPARLFDDARCLPSGSLDAVVVTHSTQTSEVEVSPLDAGVAARRMAFSSRHELSVLDDCYAKFRFAFPTLRNPHLERAEERFIDILTSALAGRPAFAVDHPYPASIPELAQAMAAPLSRLGPAQRLDSGGSS